MSKAEEYQTSYKECFHKYDSETIESLSYLIEEMIETIRELEDSVSKECQTKKLKQEASARTRVKL